MPTTNTNVERISVYRSNKKSLRLLKKDAGPFLEKVCANFKDLWILSLPKPTLKWVETPYSTS
jgi:hypothetical protein